MKFQKKKKIEFTHLKDAPYQVMFKVPTEKWKITSNLLGCFGQMLPPQGPLRAGQPEGWLNNEWLNNQEAVYQVSGILYLLPQV